MTRAVSRKSSFSDKLSISQKTLLVKGQEKIMKNERKDWCKLPYALLHDERLIPADAVVYAVLADVLHDGRADINVADIVELTGVPERTAYRSLKKLKDTGYILSAKSTGRKLMLELERIVPEAKAKKKLEPEENPENVEEALINILSRKMTGRSQEAVAKKYEELKAQASARVNDQSKTLAYLSKMISNYQDKPDNSDGFDADEYECFLNNF